MRPAHLVRSRVIGSGAFVLFFVLGLSLVVGIAIPGYLQAKKRREAMVAFAATCSPARTSWTSRTS